MEKYRVSTFVDKSLTLIEGKYPIWHRFRWDSAFTFLVRASTTTYGVACSRRQQQHSSSSWCCRAGKRHLLRSWVKVASLCRLVCGAVVEASVSRRSRRSSGSYTTILYYYSAVCFRLHSALTHSLRLGWSNVAAALNLLSSSSVLPPRLFRRHDHMCVHGEPTDKILIAQV